jgi:signal transduction histidine kinase
MITPDGEHARLCRPGSSTSSAPPAAPPRPASQPPAPADRAGTGHVAARGVALAGVMALALAVLPQLQFAYGGMSIHVALETSASLIALLAGFLVFGRLKRRGRLNDLLLACALAALGLLNLCLLTMPALAQFLPKDLIVWVLIIGRLLAAIVFALAAFAPPHQLQRTGLVLAAAVVGGSTAVWLTAAMIHGFDGYSPHRLATVLAAGSPKGTRLGGQPELLILQLVATVFYGAATVGFRRDSRRLGDEFLGWLAAAGALAAFSHLNYSLYAHPYEQLVHVGDIFRILSYAMLLIGSMREISSYWHALGEAAMSEERERIARELHDGLAQELACLARNLDSFDGERSAETYTLLRAAVERAQRESRQIVSHLAPPGVEPLDVALAKAASESAERFGVGLQLGLALGVKVSAMQQEALVRIAREAVTNAARHSGADQVDLKLERDGSRLRLRVSDRGRGFDPSVTGGGFGLVSMRQRAGSVGCELRISSALGEGSEVEVTM